MKYVFTKRDAAIVGIAAYLFLPLIFMIIGISLVNSYATEICDYYKVSGFEGGRGYFIAFAAWPISVFIGSVIGGLLAFVIHMCCDRLGSQPPS